MAEVVDVSIRGLQEGVSRTPLEEFKGKLDDYESETTTFTPPTVNINLHFTDLEVIKSDEPYQFPIANLPIKFSKRANSAWGIFSQSVAKLVPDDEDIKDQKGKMMHLKRRSHIFGQDRTTGDDMVGFVWEVQEIEGSGPKVDPTEVALAILDGKTEAEFGQKVFADKDVKKSPELQKQIIGKTWVASMITAGRVTKDENAVHHLVK